MLSSIVILNKYSDLGYLILRRILTMKYMLINNFENVNKSIMDRNNSVTLNTDADMTIPSKCYKDCLKKSKRYRSAFTTEQINYLEKEFKKFPYIGSANRKELAKILNISERAIKIWFQNRRMKEKREVNGNKQLIIDGKNNINTAFSNEQLNNLNEPDNDCGLNELLLTSQKQYVKEQNTESCNTHYSLNIRPCLDSQTKEESINNVDPPSNKYNNRIMELTKDYRDPNRFKSMPQKIRNDKKIISAQTQKFQQKNTCVEHFNNVNKEFTNQAKRPMPPHSKKDREVAEDLSLNNHLVDKKVGHHFYPVNSNPDQRFVPFFTQGYYMPQAIVPPAVNSSNVIWKPVSVMPIMSGLAPVSNTIAHNGSGFSLNNHDISKGTCNCHSPSDLLNARMQSGARTQPQYILAIPFSNTSNRI